MIAVRHTCDEATDGAACLLAEGRSDSVFGLPGTGEGDDTAMVEPVHDRFGDPPDEAGGLP